MSYSGCLRVPRQSLRIAVVQFAPKVCLMPCHVVDNLHTGYPDRPCSTKYRKGEKVL